MLGSDLWKETPEAIQKGYDFCYFLDVLALTKPLHLSILLIDESRSG